jgi:GTP-binding protein EngB required for normal cell division
MKVDDELPVVNVFAGESFGTDDTRCVYALASEDTQKRESRVIVLVGPSNAGKSALIDFMCNFFYGAQFVSPIRYRIANEQFDSSTPPKAVIKYVFNGTAMPFQFIIVDTPNFGDLSRSKSGLLHILTDWLSSTQNFVHCVAVVLPCHPSAISPQVESDLKNVLHCFPEALRLNAVPLLTFTENTKFSEESLKGLGLQNNPRFFFNTDTVFTPPSRSFNSVSH